MSLVNSTEFVEALRTAWLAAPESARRVLLTGPTEVDGDSIGACLAMRHLLRGAGIPADIAGDPGPRYAWIPGAGDMVSESRLHGPYLAVIVLDGDKSRLPPRVSTLFANAAFKGLVDHHASSTPDGYTHAWIEPHATSTCEMVYDALVTRAAPDAPALDRDLATALYVGSIFDTGGFRFSNTTPATHRMAAALLETGIDHAAIAIRVLMQRRPVGMRAAGYIYTHAGFHLEGRVTLAALSDAELKSLDASLGDLEGVIDGLLYVDGVEVAAMLTERGNGRVKVSFRSRGRVNVARLAQSLSPIGGGHAKAAGATMQGTLGEARQRILDALADALA